MSIQQSVREQMIEAMKAKDPVRLSTLRGLSAAFTNELVAKKRKPDELLSDEEALGVISRQARQRKDSIEQFEKGGRPELAESEKAELAILEVYLPKQMSRDEIESYIKAKLATEPIDPAKKNQFMGAIMKELKGKVDGSVVKDVVDLTFK